MARGLIIGGFLAVVFWVFSIVDCAAQPATRHRGVSKGTWILIVVLIPVIGGILWFIIGRRRGSTSGFVVPNAPDDDPEFLEHIRRREQDERIRRLEEELAKLDEEGDEGPPAGTRP